MTYFQAVVIALIQGVTEMFPISSLGHSVNGYRGQAGRMPFAWMAGLKPPVILGQIREPPSRWKQTPFMFPYAASDMRTFR